MNLTLTLHTQTKYLEHEKHDMEVKPPIYIYSKNRDESDSNSTHQTKHLEHEKYNMEVQLRKMNLTMIPHLNIYRSKKKLTKKLVFPI